MYAYSLKDILVILPALLVGIWAQNKVKRAYNTYRQVPTKNGIPAYQVAARLLQSFSSEEVEIKRVKGELTDHYNPRDKTLALSSGIHGSNSVAAVAVAAHEIGHALQDKAEYIPLRLRSFMVPIINFASNAYWILFLMGFLFSFNVLIDAGIFVFALSFIFSLVTLPVEFNASSRAMDMLSESGVLTEEELPQARAVLDAAALTYVAATFSALSQLLRLLLIRNSNRRD